MTNLELYRLKVEKDHESFVVLLWFFSYSWWWWNLEGLWGTPAENRRPFTYIMRDWLFPHIAWFITIVIIWYIGLFAWAHWMIYPPMLLGILSALLIAHLVWGSTWIPGEMTLKEQNNG